MEIFQRSESAEPTFSAGLEQEWIDAMPFSSERHLAMAKLIGEKAPRCGHCAERAVQLSNSFVVCARLAAAERGGISLAAFQWSAASPDWSFIDRQTDGLEPIMLKSPPLAPDAI